jgi:membrane fusion protein (multidrug efflux system)
MKEWRVRKMENQNGKNKKIISVLGFVVLLAIISSVAYFLIHAHTVTTDDAYITGRIHSVAPKVSGTVKEVYVEDNQVVKAGQVLLDIDPVDYELQVSSTKAAFAAEQVRLRDAERGIRSARISLRQAWRDKQRADALFKENVIPREKHEKVGTAYKLAMEQFKAARANKDLEEALVKQREIAFQTAQRNLGYTKIYAPSDGYVTKKSVESGNQIQTGQALMAVVALHDIWVVANYKETQLKNVRPGQRAVVKVDTYPGKVFAGRVDSIMAGTGAVFSLFPPENALGNYVKVVQRIPVKIILDKSAEGESVLRIGMSCVASITTQHE